MFYLVSDYFPPLLLVQRYSRGGRLGRVDQVEHEGGRRLAQPHLVAKDASLFRVQHGGQREQHMAADAKLRCTHEAHAVEDRLPQ